MKESLYGWYPPARDILQNYAGKQPMTPYTKECFYKHSNSRYADKHGVKTPEDPLDRPSSPVQIRKYHSWARAASRASQGSDRAKSASTINLEIRGVNKPASRASSAVGGSRTAPIATPQPRPHPPSAPPATRPDSGISSRATPDVKLFAPSPEVKVLTPSPPASFQRHKSASSQGSVRRSAKAWCTKTQETNHIPDFHDFMKEMEQQQQQQQDQERLLVPACPHVSGPIHIPRQTPLVEQNPNYRNNLATPTRDEIHTAPTERHDRIKSATSYRPKVCTHRPVKSAGPMRHTPVSAAPDVEQVEDDTKQDPKKKKVPTATLR